MTSETRTRRRDDDLRQVAVMAAAEVIKTATETAASLAQSALQESRMQTQSMKTDLEYIKADISKINEKLDNKYVTTEAFEPVRRVVYGLTALILTTVFVAVLTLVIRQAN